MAAALGSACRDAGFFYVTGYGFAAGLPAQVFQAAHAFFAPPIEEKQRLSIKHSPHNRGHVEMQGERLQHAGRSAGRSPRLCASRGESEMRTSEPKPPVGCALRVCRSFHPHYHLPFTRPTSNISKRWRAMNVESRVIVDAANPRHEREWAVWKDAKLPDDTILIPGVVSHCVHLVEHPELVAQRIERYASIVGRESVLASNDCGFATSAAGDEVNAEVAWAKLEALVEGAQIASARLWPRSAAA